MNLAELQVELRTIEDKISVLRNEIEKMKPKTEDEKKTEFEKITKLAERHPVINSKIQDAPADVKKLIMAGLSYIIQAEENDRYDRLLFLCRLAKGSG
jgi:predicted  nucleic acid-binding Zn-ribbon protein